MGQRGACRPKLPRWSVDVRPAAAIHRDQIVPGSKNEFAVNQVSRGDEDYDWAHHRELTSIQNKRTDSASNTRNQDNFRSDLRWTAPGSLNSVELPSRKSVSLPDDPPCPFCAALVTRTKSLCTRRAALSGVARPASSAAWTLHHLSLIQGRQK